MSNYAKRIARSKEEISASAITLAEKQAKLSVAAEINKSEVRLATLEAAKEQALGANPFIYNNLKSLLKEEAEVKADLAAAKELLTTEFAD